MEEYAFYGLVFTYYRVRCVMCLTCAGQLILVLVIAFLAYGFTPLWNRVCTIIVYFVKERCALALSALTLASRKPGGGEFENPRGLIV